MTTAAPRIAVAGRPYPRRLQLSCHFEGEEHAKLRTELVKAKGVAREGKSLTALVSICDITILEQGREENNPLQNTIRLDPCSPHQG